MNGTNIQQNVDINTFYHITAERVVVLVLEIIITDYCVFFVCVSVMLGVFNILST